ncbi:MAG TPA: hypothetical protein VF201_12040, partial [Nitrolancea sp.]
MITQILRHFSLRRSGAEAEETMSFFAAVKNLLFVILLLSRWASHERSSTAVQDDKDPSVSARENPYLLRPFSYGATLKQRLSKYSYSQRQRKSVGVEGRAR